LDGDRVEITFTIKNTGYIPIKIENIKTSCGFMVPVWEVKRINPNEDEVIELVYNAKNKGSETGRPRKHTVKVQLNGLIEIVNINFRVYK